MREILPITHGSTASRSVVAGGAFGARWMPGIRRSNKMYCVGRRFMTQQQGNPD